MLSRRNTFAAVAARVACGCRTPGGVAAAFFAVACAGAGCGPAAGAGGETERGVDEASAVDPRGARDRCWKRCGADAACVAACVRDERAGLDLSDRWRAPAWAGASTAFVVAPGGDDAAPGTLERPLATLGRARDLAAEAVARTNAPVVVYLRGGWYPLLEPVVFRPEHSGRPGAIITYTAYPGERPILHGSFSFSNGSGAFFDAAPVATVSGPQTPSRFVLTSPLREQVAAKLAALRPSSNGGRFVVTQAFANGARLTRSRHPNADVDVGTDYLHPPPGVERQPYFLLPAGVVAPMAHLLAAGDVELSFTDNWQHARAPAVDSNDAGGGRRGVVAAIDVARLTAVPREHEKGHFENSPAFVDAPGEWWFDERELALYALVDRPGETNINLPVNPTLVRLDGDSGAAPVHHLLFDGLAFAFTSWRYENWQGNSNFYGFGQAASGLSGAFDGDFVSDVAVTNARFEHLGANAISLGGLRGDGNAVAPGQPGTADGMAARVGVRASSFVDVGGSALRVNNAGWAETDNSFVDNEIAGAGEVFYDAPAISIFGSSATVVARNRVSHVPYTGIAFGLNCQYGNADFNVVRENALTDTMYRLRDGAPIYISSPFGVADGNVIEASGARRAADAPPFPGLDFGFDEPGLSPDLYFDDYAFYWKAVDNRLKAYFSKDATNDFYGNAPRREAASRLQRSASGRPAAENCPVGASGEGRGPPRGFPW